MWALMLVVIWKCKSSTELGISYCIIFDVVHHVFQYQIVSTVVAEVSDRQAQTGATRVLSHNVDWICCTGHRTLTGDRPWVNHYIPESKRAFMEWKFVRYPTIKKCKAAWTVSKVRLTIFWGGEGILRIDFLNHGTMVNLDCYCAALAKLKQQINTQVSCRMVSSCFMTVIAYKCLTKQQTVCESLVGSYCIIHHRGPIWCQVTHLFGPMKKYLTGQQLKSDFEIMETTRLWFQAQRTQFFQDGISKLLCK
jgi:hypothetical protein